jgi:hypothetical protein
MRPTAVLGVGAEGYGMDIVAEAHDGGWRFCRTHDFGTLAELFELDPAAARETSDWMHTWQDVLQLLDREEAWNLFPIYVHPMFANAVRAALV